MVNSKHPHNRFFANPLSRGLLLLVLTTFLCAGRTTMNAQVNNVPQKKVLSLLLMRNDDKTTLTHEKTLRDVLTDGLGGRIDYYSEYVDIARFGGDDYQTALRDFLKQKYKGIDFDVIIAP